MSAEKLGFKEFRFGWQVVFASMIGIGLGMSPLPFYTLVVFSAELVEAFGWSRKAVFFGLFVFTLSAFFAAPLIGRLTDRYGVRKVVLISIVTFSVTFMAFALNNGNYYLYLGLWSLLAFAGAGTLPITFTRAVTGWFNARRGLALGIALLATGIFGGAALRYSAWVAAEFNWQIAYIAVGALPLLIAWPIAYFLLRSIDDPKVAEKAAAHKALQEGVEVTEPVEVKDGMLFKNALKDWRFWLLAYVFIPVSFSVGGPIPLIGFILQEKGFEQELSFAIASYIGIAVFVGRLGGGYIIDKVWAPGVAFVLLAMPVITLAMFAYGTLTPATALIAVCLLGIAAGVEYDLMAFLVSKYFGLQNYGAIYGALYGFFALGAGLSPFIYSWAQETHGGYGKILEIAIYVLIAGVIPLLFLGKYREFDGERVISPAKE